ncbi:C-type mannose receptor 2-like [Battus philenor]|uniref:C-type mannose receptor 2-like n=1 Tax=Battus philenor TaxID=42288 RepID=UPI0035D0D1AB
MLKNIFILIQISLCVTFSESWEYRYDYKYYQQVEGWLKVHRVPAVWHDARLRCQLEGAVLASPTNARISTLLEAVVAGHFPGGIFTGVHATFSKGDYYSVDGIPLGRMPIKWAPGEPNNVENSEECLVLSSNGVKDVKCTDVHPYVCFKKKTGPIVHTECGTIDPEYKLDTRTGKCYKTHYVGRPWSRAFMACSAEGGYLAVINSEIEATVLKDAFARYPDSKITGDIRDIASIGFHDWNERRVWTTIQGQSIQETGYTTFENGQPDNAPNGEYCGSIFRSGKLNDLWCYRNAPFICEKETDSLLVNDYDY